MINRRIKKGQTIKKEMLFRNLLAQPYQGWKVNLIITVLVK